MGRGEGRGEGSVTFWPRKRGGRGEDDAEVEGMSRKKDNFLEERKGGIMERRRGTGGER